MEVLGVLAGLGGKPIETLEPSEARKQPTPTDAAMKIIKDKKLDVKPHEGLKVYGDDDPTTIELFKDELF